MVRPPFESKVFWVIVIPVDVDHHDAGTGVVAHQVAAEHHAASGRVVRVHADGLGGCRSAADVGEAIVVHGVVGDGDVRGRGAAAEADFDAATALVAREVGGDLDGAHRADQQDAVEGVGVAGGRPRHFVERDQRAACRRLSVRMPELFTVTKLLRTVALAPWKVMP